MFSISMDEIKRVFRDFYNVTHFMIVLFDAERRALVSYPAQMCRFCHEVRKCEALAAACKKCDENGFDMCDKTRKPYIYRCHLGVVEAIAPIYAGDVTAGYLMLGQIRQENAAEIKKATALANCKHGTQLTDEMVDEIMEANEAFITSAVNMMTMCASYLYASEIIRSTPDILIYQIKEYVRTNLGGDLSLDAICKKFYISRTKLYHISHEAFGMGFSQYVRNERIREAKRLLQTGDLSISAVATAVGIPDDNYFIRLFRAAQGVTPLQYRKARR